MDRWFALSIERATRQHRVPASSVRVRESPFLSSTCW